MRMQSSQANCGSTSVYNAAHTLGRTVITLEECEKACGVTATEGTSTKKLIAGAKAVGLKVLDEIKEIRDDVALLLLESWIRRGAVPIIAVDSDSHWATVIGSCGQRYLVADSSDSELVLSYSSGELLQRWNNPESKKHYYAAIVTA